MQIATVKFLSDNRIVDYPIVHSEEFEVGDQVIVDTNQARELSRIEDIYKSPSSKKLKHAVGVGKIIRKVRIEDIEKNKKLKQKAKSLIPECIKKTKQHDLENIKILDADLSFDEKKLTVYFSSDERIDFRDLVADMVRTFKKLIRLQQIGARDQAKRICSFGKCGRPTCCCLYLQDAREINFDLAKEQKIAESGIGRILGVCGKPTCCLRYEVEFYKETLAKMPKIGTKLKTKVGEGEVIEQNVLKNTVTVKLPNKTRVELPV